MVDTVCNNKCNKKSSMGNVAKQQGNDTIVLLMRQNHAAELRELPQVDKFNRVNGLWWPMAD